VRLSGRIAIVTGAGGGIGRAAVARLAADGAAVVASDLDPPDVEGAAIALAADVTEPSAWEEMVTAARDLGGIDVLVNNAGIEGAVAPLADYPLADFDRVMAVNVRGPFLGTAAVVPAMRERGRGSIVNLASVAGLRGSSLISAYAISKHAVIGLTRSAARELAADGIRVNAVCPAPIETRMMRSLEQSLAPGAEAGLQESIRRSIPLGRYGEPHEVAEVVAFLASDDAAFLSGVALPVDGAMTA